VELDLPASTGLIPGIVDSDEFQRAKDEPALPLDWQWNHNPDNEHWSLTERPGYLRITTGRVDENIMSARNMLTQRTIGPECTGTTSVDVSGLNDGDFAGLCLLQQNYGVVGVKADGSAKQIVMVKGSAPRRGRGRGRRQESNGDPPSDAVVDAVPLEQDTVYLRAVCDFRDRTDKARFCYSLDGESWTAIGDELQMRYTLPHFMGYRFGLFNYATKEASGRADFDYFHITGEMLSNN
jgi:beta-xylosidase